MSGIFDFWNDAGNYKNRVVAHDNVGKLVVDTTAVSDGIRPYETGIIHPDYKDGKWIIVEAYDTKSEARAGHKKWLEKMAKEPLPEALADCQNAKIASFGSALTGNQMIYERKSHEGKGRKTKTK